MDVENTCTSGDKTVELARDIFGVYFNIKRLVGIDAAARAEPEKRLSFLLAINGTMPWLPLYISRISNPIVSLVLTYLEWVLRGFSQLYLCNNPVTGIIVFVAIMINSTRIGVHVLVANLSATFTSRFLGFPIPLIASGLFAFNAELFGIAIATFHSTEMHSGYTLDAMLLVIIGPMFVVIIFSSLSKILGPYGASPLALPFDICIFTVLLASTQMSKLNFIQQGPYVGMPSYEPTADAPYDYSFGEFLKLVMKGIGFVTLHEHLPSSIMALVAISICSRIQAAAAFIGSVIGTGLAIAMGLATVPLEQGKFGYASVLTCLATGVFFVPSIGTYFLNALGLIAVVFLTAALNSLLFVWGLPPASLPFTLTFIILLLLKGDTNIMIPVQGPPTVPEEHLRHVMDLRYGFCLFFDAFEVRSRTAFIERSRRKVKRIVDLEFPDDYKKGCFRRCFECIRGCIGGCANWCLSPEGDSRPEGRLVDKFAHESFAKMGGEGEGSITNEMFGAYLATVGFPTMQSAAMLAFRVFDLNEDGSIDKDEWVTFCRATTELGKVQDLLRNFFKAIDVNRDWFIHLDELDDALRSLGEPILSGEERTIIIRRGKERNLTLDPNQAEVEELMVYICAEMISKLVKEKKSKNKRKSSSNL